VITTIVPALRETTSVSVANVTVWSQPKTCLDHRKAGRTRGALRVTSLKIL